MDEKEGYVVGDDGNWHHPHCERWEKGENCGWDQRAARMILLPFLLGMLFVSFLVLRKLLTRNRNWRARPCLCLIAVMISQGADIVEHLLVLTELRPGDHEWYPNNFVDALGDIFLMYSLHLFAEIWCDCATVLRAGSRSDLGQTDDEIRAATATVDVQRIRKIYLFAALASVPLACLFALGSLTKHYDQFMMLYSLWGVLCGIALLTPAAFLMHKTITNMPKGVRDTNLFQQLDYMARVKIFEQLTWNMLMAVTVLAIINFLHGRGKSALAIGTASVAISISWIIIQLQVVLFFATVSKAGAEANPVFDGALLTSLVSSGGDYSSLSEERIGEALNASSYSLDSDRIELGGLQSIPASDGADDIDEAQGDQSFLSSHAAEQQALREI